MFYMNMRSDLSELMLHMKMCKDRTYFTHEYEMRSVRTNVAYKNVKSSNKYYTRICFVRTYVTYENVVCPNLRFDQKYVVL